MQKTVLAALLGILCTLWSASVSAGPSQGSSVSVYQYGTLCSTNTVQARNAFTLAGSGFRTGTTAKICLTGQYPCLVTQVDNSGTFSQAEFLYYTGTYQVHVYQGSKRSGPDLVYSGQLSVVN